MLTLTAKHLGLSGKTGSTAYADAAKISGWANEFVDYVTANGIMNGSGSNFVPQGNFTREQSITTMYRLYGQV